MYLILILFFHLTIAALNDICDNRFSVVSDLSQEDCENGFYYMENSVHSCFPSCAAAITNPNVQCDPNPCPPGYLCNKKNKCEVDLDSCMKYYVDLDNKNEYINAAWKPKCLPDGTWAPKQCKGEEANGRCFCYGRTGTRIFGQQWSTKADKMTCACSRQREELALTNWFVGLHCDDEGNYEPLQCQIDQCWCAEPQTGKVVSAIVPESMISYLPCYNKTTVGNQYLRQCDSQYYAQIKTTRELNIHGTTQVYFPTLVCDADGRYGPTKVTNGIAYCINNDNTNLGSWQIAASGIDTTKLKCYCARDSVIYANEGLTQTQACAIDGSYEPKQKIGTQTYCVDGDGFAITELEDEDIDCSTIKF